MPTSRPPMSAPISASISAPSPAASAPHVSRRQLGGLVLAAGGALLLPSGAAAAATGPARRRATTALTAGQPYASNWHPADLLHWDPDTEPDSAFMRSTTPIAERVADKLTHSNPDARARRVLACSAFAPTDGNPAQGSPEFDYYTSEFWTYIDTLIFWGGSASEGLILAPNPTIVDAAHRNGVPVYGTIFFPPTAYGGEIEWVEDLLTRKGGSFPVARSLASIADYYGFEGWFFNQETDGGDARLARRMVAFMAELHDLGSRVLWYDAMTESGAVGWQGALNASNDAFFAQADGMFLDFRWSTASLASSAAYARQLQRGPDELFAGIDTGAQQFGVQGEMDLIFPPSSGSGVSVALYRPDFTLTGTDDHSQYEARESRFWVGADGDPSKSTPDGEGWRGMSAEVGEHASVMSLPFFTAFGTGHGTQWSHGGQQWQTGEWNNLTAQDVLPTWRWIFDGSPLTAGYDYDVAWQGGSSLRIRGRLHRATTMPLYATRLTVTEWTALRLVASGDGVSAAVVRFLDDPTTDIVLPLTPRALGGQWSRLDSEPLTAYAGRILIRVGILLSGVQSVSVRLGSLLLHDEPASHPAAPRHVRARASGPGVRIYWQGDPGVRYDLEAVSDSGERSWLGASTAEAFYAWAVPADAHRIAVIPIGRDGRRGPAGETDAPTS